MDLIPNHLPRTTGLRSFFLAGFECASQRHSDGVRLDLLDATGHARHFAADYRRIVAQGIRVARDGMRWHLVEKAPGFYDWTSVAPMERAARETGVQIIWDLCHYGYPDGLDIWSPAFPERFARFSRAAARFLREQSDETSYYCPINEISFWAWAGGDMARFNPNAKRRGGELKRQLARAAIASIDAIREVDPGARFIVAEPLIHVAPKDGGARAAADAENYRISQFEAHDMLIGAREPELGGSPDKLDIVGVNYYPANQWVLGGATIPLGDHSYRPLREMLAETARRYGRPLIVSELGAENTARSAWLYYVAQEVAASREAGVGVEAMCLYPILDYPGWENDRRCDVGLFGEPDAAGERRLYQPLADELARQRLRFEGNGVAPGSVIEQDRVPLSYREAS